MGPSIDTTEQKRLNDAREAGMPWKKWGPYVSERQWGTVREDYSDDGNAWDYFTHDQARSRAYRWGEDGLGALCDDKQQLCFALALWNERDPILKERLFGLTNSEANHGEDVKEYYFYVDSTPTHSYMKYLYKYPQREYPYRDLVDTNRRRSRNEFEYELLDTGVFDEDRYFDVFVEYAKAGPEDIFVRITVHNRGPEAARLHVVPTLWFRNTWSWDADRPKPSLREAGPGVIQAAHPELGEYWLFCEGAPELLFTENESNASRLWGQPNASPYVKDAFHEYIVSGRRDAVNPAKIGTKGAAHYALEVPARGSHTVSLRLGDAALAGIKAGDAFGGTQKIFNSRIADADEFYDRIAPTSLTDDERLVHRQALAGMLWSKQFYNFDLDRWLREHRSHPLLESSRPGVRNTEWFHMINADVISMPDKWEYPWYAAWDLAFHAIALSLVDFDFAKEQLLLMLRSLAVVIGGPNQYRPETNLPIMWVGPLPMEGARVIASVGALVALALFYLVMSKTWIGLALRATAQNRVAAQTSGVDVFRLDAMAFAIGVALAGLAGALLAPVFLVYPTNGVVTTVKGFEIIVIGGLGSIPGALIGGVLLGVVESLGAAFISSPYQNAYGFILVLLVLMFRPYGLFGERGREA